jgi:hypothetical protein
MGTIVTPAIPIEYPLTRDFAKPVSAVATSRRGGFARRPVYHGKEEEVSRTTGQARTRMGRGVARLPKVTPP